MKTSWTNFTEKELSCSCCGRTNPNKEFEILMHMVQALRTELDFSMGVTSAYRCENHPIEARKIAKGKPAGEHTKAAIDLAVSRLEGYLVLQKALGMGFTGIGVQQKGNGRFIHLDIRETPALWSY